MPIRVKRIYRPAEPADGVRVLVDRLWPRGMSKERAQIDVWAKEVAPSHELRTWFNHEPDRFAQFAARYEEELTSRPTAIAELMAHAKRGPLTLLFAAADEDHNQARVLAEYLARKLDEPGRS